MSADKQFIIFKFKSFFRLVLVFIFAFLCFFVGRSAHAASLYLSPSNKTCSVGQTCSIAVYVTSQDQAMNAASGVISFSADKLETVSLSKTGSIFGLWVEEPSFSNSSGSINFEGIVMNPGFTGSGGKLLTINFRPKTAGSTDVIVTSASVLANDGQGTEILQGTSNTVLNIENSSANQSNSVPVSSAPDAAPKSTVSPASVPAAPSITSSTHPDQSQWYNNNSPKFSWTVPSGVTAIRLLYNDKPDTQPSITYSPAISEKALSNIPDGIWYIHAQFKNQKGWGQVSHFRFQIDTTPPEQFKIRAVEGPQASSLRPTILFNTTDAVSGIDHYIIKIGDGEFTTVSDEQVAHNPYTLPPQTPGKRTILAKAIDRAGNYVTDATEITITGLATPTVSSYAKELRPGDHLIIKGQSLPKIRLSIWLVKEGGQPERYVTYAEEDGSFVFVYPNKLETGMYSFWMIAADSNDATSEPTQKYTIVAKIPQLENFLTTLLRIFSVSVPLVGLIVVLFFILWRAWYKFRSLKKKLHMEAGEAESALHEAFKLLRNSTTNNIKLLEKIKTRRELTNEEAKLVRKFKDDLAGTEQFIGQEIKQIEDDTK